jgi:hypothetical protein
VRPTQKRLLGLAAVLLSAVGVVVAVYGASGTRPSTAPAAAEASAEPSPEPPAEAKVPSATPTVAASGKEGLNAAVASMVSPPKFACDSFASKDAPDKGAVLAIYVHQPGKDNYRTEATRIRQILFETDQTFDASARRLGTSRRIRFAQDTSCTPLVANVTVTKGEKDGTFINEFWRQFTSQPALVQNLKDRMWRVKFLAFADDDEIFGGCRGGGANAGLGGGTAYLPRWCWGEAGLTHEFGHTFGLSHCGNGTVNPIGNDPMCRNWGTIPECVSDVASNFFLDSCRSDDFRYFEPTPLPGKAPLAKEWNVAFSPHLITDQPTKPLNFRMQVDGTTKCLEPVRDSVVLQPCRAVPQQVWQRQIDREGYLTLRNLGTGGCLQMTTTPNEPKGVTTPAVTAPCVEAKQAQQWVPGAGGGFANRTGGRSDASLATQAGGKIDGTVVVRGDGTSWVKDYAVTQVPRA